jgi:diphosphomevalonate decarboxylase
MPSKTATALAHPNLAFIKYWGNRDDALRLPSNGSISMNLAGLETRTSVSFESGLADDELTINGVSATGLALERVIGVLDLLRGMSGMNLSARVESRNNFPAGTGIASSASAFAALALAGTKAAGLELNEAGLSRLARRGSGSACRSVPGGFVEWAAGTSDQDSFAVSIAPPEHWALADCVAVVSTEPKATGSSRGNSLAVTSPLQAARVADAPRRLDLCRNAILQRDFDALAQVVELDSNLLHAIMMTSTPALFYWKPVTLALMQLVREERIHGLPACASVDAGPNVHVITLQAEAAKVETLLRSIPGVLNVLAAGVGGPARLIDPASNFL